MHNNKFANFYETSWIGRFYHFAFDINLITTNKYDLQVYKKLRSIATIFEDGRKPRKARTKGFFDGERTVFLLGPRIVGALADEPSSN